MGRVFAVYDSSKLDLIRVWARSWEARGWEPRLLSPREVKSQSVEKLVKEKGGGFLYDLDVVNFSWSCGSTPPKGIARHGKRGWESAKLVRFESEQQVLDCGRAI